MLAWSDYPKLGNLPVQENGTTPTMYGGTVRKSLGGGGGGPVQQEEGTWLEFEDQAPNSVTTGYMPS